MSGPPDVPGGSIVTAEQHTRPLRMAHIQGTTGTASFFKNSSPTHGTLSTVLTQPATAAPCSSSLSSSTLSPTLLFKLHTPPFGIHQPASILLSGFSSTSPSDSNKTAHPAHKPLARLFHSTISSLNKLKQQLAATVDPSAPHWTHRARQTSSRRQSQRELDDSQQHPPHAGKSRPTHHRKLSPHQEAQLQERLGLRASQECRIMDAIAHFQKAAAADPGNAKVLALLSKQWTDLTYAQGAVVEVPHAHHCNSRALEYAEAAVAADPRCMSARVACCVSKGRLALFVSDARTKVKLACDAQSDVKVAIELDPSNDTAHHLMGRWNYEMVQVNAFARTLVRILYGASLMAGSYPEALACYRTAAALCPTCVIHPVEVGRTLLKLKQPEEAVVHLRHALTLTALDINDVLQHHAAEQLLTELGVPHAAGPDGKPAGHLPPHTTQQASMPAQHPAPLCAPQRQQRQQRQQQQQEGKGVENGAGGKGSAGERGGAAGGGAVAKRLTAAEVWAMARPLTAGDGVTR
ncbi:MAG: hypothetical protein WDW36_008527 [Sanguina aurantia]